MKKTFYIIFITGSTYKHLPECNSFQKRVECILQLKLGIASDGNHTEDFLQLLVDDLEASHEFLVALLLDLSQEASHFIPSVGRFLQGIAQGNELGFLSV